MKRFISLFVAFLLVISPLAGVSLPADAAETTVISEISLPQLPELAEGSSTDLSWAVAPAGEHYTIDLTLSRWLYQENSIAMGQHDEPTFGKGLYTLELYLIPEEGYSFADSVRVTTAGYNQEARCDGYYLYVEAEDVLDTRELIPALAFTGFPEAVDGESYDCSAVVCDTEGVTVEAKVYDNNDWGTSGTFYAEKFYLFNIHLEFPADKKVSDETVITVNGKPIEGWVCSYRGCSADLMSPEVEVLSFVIDEIELLDLIEVACGKPTDLSGIRAPEDAPYYVDYSSPWTRVLKYEEDVGDNYSEAAFSEGEFSYRLAIQPKEGYRFADQVSVKCEESGFVAGYPVSGVLVAFSPKYTVVAEPITQVSISYAEPVKGQALADQAQIPENAPYSVKSFDWFDSHGNKVSQFDKGVYYAAIQLESAEGYSFTQDTTVQVNGKTVSNWTIQDGKLSVTVMYAVDVEWIDTVEISFTQPGDGETAPEVTLENDELYEHTSFLFYDYKIEDYMEPNAIFQLGGEYSIDVELEAKDGYAFAEEVTFIVNGEECSCYEDHDAIDYYAYHDFKLTVVIDTVEITFPEPEMGKAVPEITLKDAQRFQEDPHISWYNLDRGDSVEFFQETGDYELYIDLYAAESCSFAEELTIIINGEEVDADLTYYSDTNVGIYHYFDLEDTREIVPAVDFPAWPSFQVGDPIPAAVLPEPSDDPFAQASMVLVYDPEQISEENPDGFVPASGVFEEGKLYRMEYAALANEGYRFVSGTTKVTQAGQSVTPQVFESEALVLQKYYNFSDQVVADTVDLLLTQPALGEEPSEVTVAEDAPYTVEYYDWGSTKDPESMDIRDVTDAFPAGYPVLYVVLEAEEGAIFADNAAVTVNGKAAAATVMEKSSAHMILQIVLEELKPNVIPAVDFPAWPELKPGDSFEFLNDLMLLPDQGGVYGIVAQMQDSDGNNVSPTDTVEEGKTYTLTMVAVCAERTHAFTDATKVTQNGKAATGRVDLTGFGAPPEVNEQLIVLIKIYNFNEDVTVLERIDITVDEPKIGREPGSIGLSEDSPLEMVKAMWGTSTDGTMEKANNKKGAWEEGEYPVLGIEVNAPEDVIVSPTAQIYVNGKLQKNAGLQSMGNRNMVFVFMDQLTTNPPTGDTTNLGIYGAAMLLSLCGLGGVLLVSKKRRNA